MELSPKQQAINEIKKANSILILGQKSPDGDHLGSMLALFKALQKLEKTVEVISSEEIDAIFGFLPGINKIKTKLGYSNDKIIRIDTERVPIQGMKWQKEENYLNIYLETEKNLKFEFIEIDNGRPRPDLIIVLSTLDLDRVDSFYDQNTELFYEVPVINIDHHSGNDYFGTVNLVDLTATSTAEILVSLFEALGLKIDDEEIATNLLAGIIYNTQSFRNQNTTPKSLTVAAQLLAAGAKQQEIISNFYKKKPIELLKSWGEMLNNINEDRAHRFAWTKIDTTKDVNITKEDIFSAADDLLTNTPEADIILIIYKGARDPGTVFAKVKGSRNKEVQSIAGLFGGSGTTIDSYFQLNEEDLNTAEKIILKKIAELWGKNQNATKKEVWDLIDETPKNSPNETEMEEKESATKIEKSPKIKTAEKEKRDAIEEAIRSISQAEGSKEQKSFEHIGEVISRKNAGGMRNIKRNEAIEEIDVFDEEEL